MKKIFAMLATVAVLAVCFTIFAAAETVELTNFTVESTEEIKDVYPKMRYGSTVTKYTADQAQEAGIPAGYTGDVWKIDCLPNQATTGAMAKVDLSASNIEICDVRSITFRIYIANDVNPSANVPYAQEIRVLDPRVLGYDNWLLQYPLETITKNEQTGEYSITSSKTGQWIDVTMNKNLSALVGTDGKMGVFCFGARYWGRCDFYLDSITVEYAPRDTDIDFSITSKNANDTATNSYTHGNGTITKLSYDEATALVTSGVLPSGFSGNVWKVSGNNGTSVGAMIEFPGKNIPVANIEYIIFRIYAPKDSKSTWGPNIRIVSDAASWIWGTGDGQSQFSRYPAWTQEWCDVKVAAGDISFNRLDFDKDGYLDRFNIISRRDAPNDPFYIDTITIKYVEEIDPATLDYSKMAKLAPRPGIGNLNPPYGSKMKVYSDKAPSDAAGYEGYVWRFDGETDSGVTASIDLTGLKIPANRISAVVVRMLAPSPASQIRMNTVGATTMERILYDGGRFYMLNAESEIGKWFDFRVTNDMLRTGYKFADLADENGYFEGFEIGVFHGKHCYIDSVEVELLDTSEFNCDIENYTTNNNTGTVIEYSADNLPAELAGTSCGGTVLKVIGAGSGSTVDFDFRRAMILASEIDSVSVRLWAPAENDKNFIEGSYPQIRFSNYRGANSWWNYSSTDGSHLLKFDLERLNKQNQWVDIEITDAYLRTLNKGFDRDVNKEGGYFKGFTLNIISKSNQYFYIDSISIKLKQDAAPVEIDGGMLGAQIRTTAPQGLRFGTSINFTDGIALDDVQYTADTDDSFYAGTIIIPVSELPDDVTPSNFTHDNAPVNNYLDVKAENIYSSNTDAAVYTAVVLNIPETEENEELVARAYICYNGTYYYFAPVIRSVSQVENAMGDGWNN